MASKSCKTLLVFAGVLISLSACRGDKVVTGDRSVGLTIKPDDKPGVAYAVADVNCKGGNTFRLDVSNATKVSINYKEDGSIGQYQMENENGDVATVDCGANSCTRVQGNGKCTKQ